MSNTNRKAPSKDPIDTCYETLTYSIEGVCSTEFLEKFLDQLKLEKCTKIEYTVVGEDDFLDLVIHKYKMENLQEASKRYEKQLEVYNMCLKMDKSWENKRKKDIIKEAKQLGITSDDLR